MLKWETNRIYSTSISQGVLHQILLSVDVLHHRYGCSCALPASVVSLSGYFHNGWVSNSRYPNMLWHSLAWAVTDCTLIEASSKGSKYSYFPPPHFFSCLCCSYLGPWPVTVLFQCLFSVHSRCTAVLMDVGGFWDMTGQSFGPHSVIPIGLEC